MTRIALVLAALCPAPALAHPGHLAELAGHSHWIAAGALAAATALTLWVSGRRGKQEADDDGDAEDAAAEDTGDEAQEA